MTVRPFWTSKSTHSTSYHVSDIPAHVLITPDRLNVSNSQSYQMSCLGHQIHVFSKFEFLKFKKTVNGHINVQNLCNASQSSEVQEGLSITTLSVEQVTVQVKHVIILFTTVVY